MVSGARRIVQRIDQDGNIVEFKSVNEAGASVQISNATMGKWIKSGKLRCGFYWRYKDDISSQQYWVKHPKLQIHCSEEGLIKNRRGHVTRGSHRGSSCCLLGQYYSICIDKKYYQVHRLIAQTFIPNPENKPTVDHIDRNPSNNNVTNLRWATSAEQNQNRAPGEPRIKKK